MNSKVLIRRASGEDADQLQEMIGQGIAGGDTCVFAPDSSREKMLSSGDRIKTVLGIY